MPSLSTPKSLTTKESFRSAQNNPCQNNRHASTSIPSPDNSLPTQPSPSINAPQPRPSGRNSYHPSVKASTPSTPRPPSSDSRLNDQTRSISRESSSQIIYDDISVQRPSSHGSNKGRTASSIQRQERPKKQRRKLVPLHEETRASVEQAFVEPNAPIPTTEVDENTAPTGNNQLLNTARPKSRTAGLENENERRDRASAQPAGVGTQNNIDNIIPDSTLATAVETQAGSWTTRKKRRKPKARERQQVIEDAVADIVQEAIQGSAKDPEKRRRRSKRSITPEDAENARIAPSEIRMIELCRDNGVGKKSIREQELREMDRAASVKKKRQELQERMQQVNPSNLNGSAEPSPMGDDRQERQAEREQALIFSVPNTIIVNGQIQVDEDSLQIDRHAAAAVERNNEELEPIDENDLSRKITSASWLNRDKSGGWNEILQDRFYQGLRMFGTDFELISKMFPGKSRHAIKLKFCREEKLDYARVKAALLGEKLPVVLEEYERMTGVEYEDPKELERVMEEDRKKLEEEQLAEKQAIEKTQRDRESQAAAERVAIDEESGKESEERGKKKRSWKGRGKQRQPRATKKKLSQGAGVLVT